MSIQNEIDRIKSNVADAYSAIEAKGGTVPEEPNSDNLPASILSIPAGSNVPTRGIIIWSGAANNIPNGWALCDGTNNTPDLRGRFILGATTEVDEEGNTAHAIGETGGEEEVTLTVRQMPSHFHIVPYYKSIGNNVDNKLKVLDASGITSIENTEKYAASLTGNQGKNEPHNNLPPYYVLCYIMKL